MANIVVIGCGTAGVKVAESLVNTLPYASFVAVDEFDEKHTSTVPARINTSLKRRLTDDELVKHAKDLLRLPPLEIAGDSYWWWTRWYGDWGTGGIALVRGQDIVTSIINIEDNEVLLRMAYHLD